ncbi:LIC10906 family membrane protein [Leptospira yasudae]|uniref:LIC10906 family membrane protein n=1 Tax=Leptospira yasudae TaxID=2202201 RepID=UPI00109137DF|nr:histidine kinase N-terminal 7TM domain-containing protein [Leptospira yasudae]TGM99697.1 hypothetical protein EHR10_08895 [Leptospira yasudae]
MLIENILTAAIGLFLLYLGIYVYRINPRKKVQRYFLYLCIMVFLWMTGLSIRSIIPIANRESFLNLILFPVIFIPLFLDFVVNSLTNRFIHFNLYRIVLVCVIIPLFSLISLSGSFVRIEDPILYKYTPTLNYHIIIAYCVVSILVSALNLGRFMIRRHGDERIRSFLMLIGIIIALPVSITFVYVLPLRGSFLAAYSAFGLLPFAILWAVAILHYDAFKIREIVMVGGRLPLLSRLFSFAILGLYRLIDGHDYEIKLLLSKAHVTLNIVNKHYELTLRHPSLEKMERAKLVASVFNKRIR